MENIELYELYHNLFLGCLIACIALAAIAVLIFFVLDIRSVIGFLSGRTAKKQIQKIEEESAASGRLYRKTRRNQQYEEEKQSGERGIPPSAMPGARKVDHAVQSAHSAEIARREQLQPVIQAEKRENQPEESRRPDVGIQLQSVSRDDLCDASGTTVLTGMGVTETTILTDTGAEDTSLLDGDTEQIIAAVGNETESLRGATEPMEGPAPAEEEKSIYGYSVRRRTTGTFKIEREIVMIHSKEII